MSHRQERRAPEQGCLWSRSSIQIGDQLIQIGDQLIQLRVPAPRWLSMLAAGSDRPPQPDSTTLNGSLRRRRRAQCGKRSSDPGRAGRPREGHRLPAVGGRPGRVAFFDSHRQITMAVKVEDIDGTYSDRVEHGGLPKPSRDVGGLRKRGLNSLDRSRYRDGAPHCELVAADEGGLGFSRCRILFRSIDCCNPRVVAIDAQGVLSVRPIAVVTLARTRFPAKMGADCSRSLHPNSEGRPCRTPVP